MPSEMNPCTIHRFAANGIEAVCAMLELPSINNLQVAVVYRSPSVSQTALITLLSRLLTHISMSNTTCVILGDFNEDILHRHSTLLSFMSRFGFKQLVNSPTPPQGTLIDHVYYNNHQYSNIVVHVQDTYYTDHDTVYCSIPFTNS